MRPLLLRPAWFFNGCNNDFSGVDVVISAKSEPVMLRRPFEVGLYFLIATFFPPNLMSYLVSAYSAASNNWISFESSVNVTIALRRFFVYPAYLPIRLNFARTFTMFTFLTFTSKAASSGFFTKVLFARVSTSKVYFLSFMASIDFSVITGRLITSSKFIMQAPPQFE